jgi:hypothetical protein
MDLAYGITEKFTVLFTDLMWIRIMKDWAKFAQSLDDGKLVDDFFYEYHYSFEKFHLKEDSRNYQ